MFFACGAPHKMNTNTETKMTARQAVKLVCSPVSVSQFQLFVNLVFAPLPPLSHLSPNYLLFVTFGFQRLLDFSLYS